MNTEIIAPFTSGDYVSLFLGNIHSNTASTESHVLKNEKNVIDLIFLII
jgi:hypothetical protein